MWAVVNTAMNSDFFIKLGGFRCLRVCQLSKKNSDGGVIEWTNFSPKSTSVGQDDRFRAFCAKQRKHCVMTSYLPKSCDLISTANCWTNCFVTERGGFL